MALVGDGVASILAAKTVVKVESADGELFILDREDVAPSGWLRSAHAATPEQTLKLEHNINASAFKKVLEYIRFHRNSTGLSEKDKKQWDADFVRGEAKTLCELAAAAYYLDVKPLVDLSCKSIASLISGKSAEEIRQTFNIQNDLEESEENELRSSFLAWRRDRRVLCVKRKPKTSAATAVGKSPTSSEQTPKLEDQRSVDDLLAFIEGSASAAPTATASPPSAEQTARSGRQRNKRGNKQKSTASLSPAAQPKHGAAGVARSCAIPAESPAQSQSPSLPGPTRAQGDARRTDGKVGTAHGAEAPAATSLLSMILSAAAGRGPDRRRSDSGSEPPSPDTPEAEDDRASSVEGDAPGDAGRAAGGPSDGDGDGDGDGDAQQLEDEDDLPADLRAQLDREVAEFAARLALAQPGPRPALRL